MGRMKHPDIHPDIKQIEREINLMQQKINKKHFCEIPCCIPAAPKSKSYTEWKEGKNVKQNEAKSTGCTNK